MREFLNKAAGLMSGVKDLHELGPLGERRLPLMTKQELTLFSGVDKTSDKPVLALKVVNKSLGNYAEEWIILTEEMVERMYVVMRENK